MSEFLHNKLVRVGAGILLITGLAVTEARQTGIQRGGVFNDTDFITQYDEYLQNEIGANWQSELHNVDLLIRAMPTMKLSGYLAEITISAGIGSAVGDPAIRTLTDDGLKDKLLEGNSVHDLFSKFSTNEISIYRRSRPFVVPATLFAKYNYQKGEDFPSRLFCEFRGFTHIAKSLNKDTDLYGKTTDNLIYCYSTLNNLLQKSDPFAILGEGIDVLPIVNQSGRPVIVKTESLGYSFVPLYRAVYGLMKSSDTIINIENINPSQADEIQTGANIK